MECLSPTKGWNCASLSEEDATVRRVFFSLLLLLRLVPPSPLGSSLKSWTSFHIIIAITVMKARLPRARHTGGTDAALDKERGHNASPLLPAVFIFAYRTAGRQNHSRIMVMDRSWQPNPRVARVKDPPDSHQQQRTWQRDSYIVTSSSLLPLLFRVIGNQKREWCRYILMISYCPPATF